MIYQNLKELGNNTLHSGDIVYFYVDSRQLKYNVLPTHLSNAYRSDNAEIFSILGINKSDFCDCYYGYHNHGGDWPVCDTEDFAALTRVVQALYQKIEYRKIKENTIFYDSSNLLQELKAKLSTIGATKPILEPLILEKKKDTSSNILVKRKSKVKRIIGEESIKLNNY